MTVDDLRARRKAGFATELHLSPKEYEETYAKVKQYLQRAPETNPQRYAIHFVFEGLQVIKSLA